MTEHNPSPIIIMGLTVLLIVAVISLALGIFRNSPDESSPPPSLPVTVSATPDRSHPSTRPTYPDDIFTTTSSVLPSDGQNEGSTIYPGAEDLANSVKPPPYEQPTATPVPIYQNGGKIPK